MGYQPTCLGVDYTDKFFEPKFSSIAVQNTLHVQDNVEIAWFGGKGNIGPEQEASLSLYLLGRREHITIVDTGVFVFGDSPSFNWTYFDNCGNTKLSYNWTIPGVDILSSAFDLGQSHQQPTFEFVVSNKTTEFRSPGFSIEPSPRDTSTTADPPTSTDDSASTPPISSPTNLNAPIWTSTAPINVGSTGLSNGAKAGIGSACGVVGLLVILGVIIYIRRRRIQSLPAHNQSTSYETPELSGDGVDKQATETAGEEIHEMDSQAKAVELSAPTEIRTDAQVKYSGVFPEP